MNILRGRMKRRKREATTTKKKKKSKEKEKRIERVAEVEPPSRLVQALALYSASVICISRFPS